MVFTLDGKRALVCGASQGIGLAAARVMADLGDDLLTSDQPLVVRGLAADWPAVTHGLESTDTIVDYLKGFDSGNVVTALFAPAEAGGRGVGGLRYRSGGAVA